MFELEEMLDNGSRYMNRWRIFGSLSKSKDSGTGKTWGKKIESKLPFNLRVHRFFRGDIDTYPHNHPWKWALSFVFWGGYTQIRTDKNGTVHIEEFNAPCFNFIRHSDYHNVTTVRRNPMTLFLTGPAVSSWGFLAHGEHIPWKDFLGIEQEDKNCYYCGAVGTNMSFEEHLLEWGNWQLCHRHKSERSSPSE